MQDGKYDRLLRLLYNDIEKYETEVRRAQPFLLFHFPFSPLHSQNRQDTTDSQQLIAIMMRLVASQSWHVQCTTQI